MNFLKNFFGIACVLYLHITQTIGQEIELSPFEFENIDNTIQHSDIHNQTDDVEVLNKPVPDISKTTMDIITVIWYLSTFLALAAFFFLMACSDRRCRRSSLSTGHGNEISPPTPAPSYSEFAPPSYESVVKQQPQIYVVPISDKITNKGSTNVAFYIVDETDKNG